MGLGCPKSHRWSHSIFETSLGVGVSIRSVLQIRKVRPIVAQVESKQQTWDSDPHLTHSRALMLHHGS